MKSKRRFTLWTASQAYTVLGLVCEFISVLLTVWKLFRGYYARLGTPTTRQKIRKERVEGALILGFLIAGLVLQAYAVFI